MCASWSTKRKKGNYDKVSKNSGLYELYHGERVVYVGQSKNVRSRLQQHEKGKKGWGTYRWKSTKNMPTRTRKKSEEKRIKRAAPTRNKRRK